MDETPEERIERRDREIRNEFYGPERPICECEDGYTCQTCDPDWRQDD